MKIFNPLNSIFIVFALLLSFDSAAEGFAVIAKAENMPEYSKGDRLKADSVIITRDNQRLAIRTTGGDIIVLGENSRIKLKKPTLLEQLFGVVYYFIRPRSDEQVKVSTLTATIGIRGTNFLVSTGDADDINSIALDQGLLEVESPDDQPFRVHKNPPLDDFAQFKQEMEDGVADIKNEFDEYRKMMESEFFEYKMSVQLTSGQSLQLKGHDLVTVENSSSEKAKLAKFKEFITGIE
ncbi:MAG: hypothetical protein ACI87H_003384 [Gammaproteobacteria bacterium]|jgi:hypothetical protein